MTETANTTPRDLVTGLVEAKVLYSLCSGDQLIVVKSPPGGGKSTLMAGVATQIITHLGVSVTIACQSHNQAAAVAIKLLDTVGREHVRLHRAAGKTKPSSEHPALLDSIDDIVAPSITVRTLASLSTASTRQHWDGYNSGEHDEIDHGIVLVDEAYQASFSNGVAAISMYSQVVLVGDPGQIGPVVTARIDPWQRHNRAPQAGFAAVMENDSRSKVFDITSTYRLGPETASLIAPFYDFAFDSRRPQTWIEIGDKRIDELTSVRLRNGTDVEAASRAVELARSALGGMLHTERQSRSITQSDICVVAAMNITVTAVTAALNAAGMPDVVVGTADSLQGGEWVYVIALDPLMCEHVSDHHLSLGRLCVMLSRHRAALTFVHDGRWSHVLGSEPDLSIHRDVRRQLTL